MDQTVSPNPPAIKNGCQIWKSFIVCQLLIVNVDSPAPTQNMMEGIAYSGYLIYSKDSSNIFVTLTI